MERKSVTGYLSYSMIYFFYFFAMGIFGSMLSVYLAGIDKTPSQISLIVSASGILSMILGPAIGLWYDRSGRRKSLSIILLAAAAVSGLLFAFTKSTVLLFILNGLAMALLGGVNPVCEQVAASSPYRYGVLRLWGAVGYATATQTAGLILEHVSGRFLFILFAVTAVLTGLAFHWTGLKDAPPIRREEKQEKEKAHISTGLILFAIFSFFFSGLTSAENTYVPLFMQNLMGGSSAAGTILFIGTLMEIPIIFLSNRFMDKLSGRALLIINTLLLVIQLAVFSYVKNVALICTVLILTKSVTTMLAIMVTLKVVLILTGGRYATTALSIIGTVKSIGGVVLTNASGLWIDSHTLESVFPLMLFCTIGTLIFSLFIRVPKGDASYFSEKQS